jgi:predicted anti-sigma-YlaC factor YlaD
MNKPGWKDGDEHPSADLLLLSLEGELEPKEAAGIEEHLKYCWSCRARSERMQRSICAFVEHRDTHVLPKLPTSPSSGPSFLARLHRVALDGDIASSRSLRLSVILRRFVATIQSTGNEHRPRMSPAVVSPPGPSMSEAMSRGLRFLTIGVPRPAWISGAISIITVIAVLHFSVVQPPSMEAAEFLRRAMAAAMPTRQRPHSSRYQRVRIRRGSVVFDRVLPREAIAVGSVSPDAATKTAMSLVKMDWEAPLSAERFSNWREGPPEKEDRIFESPASLTLRTTPIDNQSSEIRYASLTVNRADWRPIAEHVEFWNQPALEVTEVSFEVHESPTVAEPATVETAPTLAVRESLASSLETELVVRYALHGVRADLGEPIEVQTGNQGPACVSVVGIVSSEDRKQELLAVLAGIPQVNAQLQTEKEAAAPAFHAPVTRAEPKIVAARSPIEKELLQYFGDPLSVENLAKRALTLTEDLMAHVSALRHLSERYSSAGSQGETVLSPTSRQLLQIMRRDHYRAMSDATSELTALLRPVLQSIVEAPPQSPPRLPLFDSALEVQRLTLEVLSGSGSPDANDNEPAQGVQDLLVALRGLELTLEE